jgi:predicted DNA-binding transcriptional regulator YafY
MKPSALSRIDRLGADMAEPLLAAAPDADGVRVAAVAIESVSHAASLLLGFADDIDVVSPAGLRDELRRRAAAVVALYGPNRRRAAPTAPDGR